MSFLLDTNVISELNKRRPAQAVQRWFESVPGAELYMSVLVIGEIRQGVERLRRRDPQAAERYSIWLSNLGEGFRDRLLPITSDIADVWGRLNATNPPPALDGLMAATAIVHHLTFVTRNTAHVSQTGAELLNPF